MNQILQLPNLLRLNQVPTRKQLHLSPSDIGTASWSWDDFYRQCVRRERFEPTPEILWGQFCHAYVGLPKHEREEKMFSIKSDYLASLEEVAEAVETYEKEVSFSRQFEVDDCDVTLNYRVDAIKEGKVIEFKFPQRAWDQSRVNSDIKTLCYRMFHDVEVWCITTRGVERFSVKRTQEQAEQKVKEAIREIIGRLELNYF